MGINAPKTLYDYDPGNLGARDQNDTNLANDINQLQIQIGDLTETLSEFGDLLQARDEDNNLIFDGPNIVRETIDTSNLVNMLNSIKRKIIYTSLGKDINGAFINNGGKIQINTIQNHGLSIGDKLTITNSSNGAVNTFHKVLTVDSLTSITLTTNYVASSGGNICKHNGKHGKILQHGEVLIPSGLVFIIAGNVSNVGESNVIGINTCPPGYTECDNITIIADPNSPFYDLENDNYTPDLKGLMIRGYSNTGSLNNPFNASNGPFDPNKTYFDPANDIFGDIFGNEDITAENHKHKLTSGIEGTFPDYDGHKHNFVHGHLHQHTVQNHNHSINGHNHNDQNTSHTHNFHVHHDHKDSSVDVTIDYATQGDYVGNIGSGHYEGPDGGSDGTHNHDINEVSIYDHESDGDIVTTSESIELSGISTNNSSSSVINANINNGLSSAGIDNFTSQESLDDFSSLAESIPKFRAVKFCIKN